MGFPYVFKMFQLADGSFVDVAILDTAGQEKFRAVGELYYKKADGILLVYDITNVKSLDELRNYYGKKIKEQCKKDVKILLLGNKTDLEEERQIPPEVGACIAKESGYMFTEASCLENKNVAGCFETLIELTYREVIQEKKEKGIIINKKNCKKKQSDCC